MKVKTLRSVFVFLGVSLWLICPVFAQQTKIIYTTLDLKQDYEIISVITGFAKVQQAVFKDPLGGAFKKAWEDLEKNARKVGADAVIGIQIDFENLTKNNAGRIVISGTAVKLK